VFAEGGITDCSQGLKLLHVLSRLLTPGQLDTSYELVDLATEEIVSGLTPENVIEEMFWNSPA
jgi:hypothetical protein